MNSNRFRPSIINIQQVKQEDSQGNIITMPPSPRLSSGKKRKKVSLIKTGEEIVKQSHDELLDYIDIVDQKVQGIIQTYEAQFLTAYKDHIRRVREEMQSIKKRSLNNANSQTAYLEKIDILEKQLKVFRGDSMKLFDKLTKKDKEINLLTMKIKQLEDTVKQQEKSMYLLARKNKQTEVWIEQAKQKMAGGDTTQSAREPPVRFTRSENKQYNNMHSNLSNELLLEGELRPYSTNIKMTRSKNKSMRLESHRKIEGNKGSDSSWFRKKIHQKLGSSQLIPVDTVIDLISQKKGTDEHSRRQGTSSNSFRKARSNYMVRMQSRRNSIIDSDLVQKSKQMAEINELRQVFNNCIEEVRKDIVRRGNGPALNFFKQNGPKSYSEFKKVDRFALLQLLVSNESISKALYQLIFNKSS